MTVDVVILIIFVGLNEKIFVIPTDSHHCDQADNNTENAHIEEDGKISAQVISRICKNHVRILRVSHFSTDNFHEVVIFASLSLFEKKWIKARKAATIVKYSIFRKFGIIGKIIIEIYLHADSVENTVEVAGVVEVDTVVTYSLTIFF